MQTDLNGYKQNIPLPNHRLHVATSTGLQRSRHEKQQFLFFLITNIYLYTDDKSIEYLNNSWQ